MRSTSEVADCCFSASTKRSRASAISRLHALSCCSRSARVWRAPPRRAFVPIKRSLRPRVRLFAPLRDKGTSVAGLARALVITARDWVCGEDSTQRRTRISLRGEWQTAPGACQPIDPFGSSASEARQFRSLSKLGRYRRHCGHRPRISRERAPHLMLELLRQVSGVAQFLARAVAASTCCCSLAETYSAW
jgi:hypothetical protein